MTSIGSREKLNLSNLDNSLKLRFKHDQKVFQQFFRRLENTRIKYAYNGIVQAQQKRDMNRNLLAWVPLKFKSYDLYYTEFYDIPSVFRN